MLYTGHVHLCCESVLCVAVLASGSQKQTQFQNCWMMMDKVNKASDSDFKNWLCLCDSGSFECHVARHIE
jgi:hypothetical protein